MRADYREARRGASLVQGDFMGALQSGEAQSTPNRSAMNDYCLYYVMALQIRTFVLTHLQQLALR